MRKFKVIHIRWFGGRGSETVASSHETLQAAAKVACATPVARHAVAVVNGRKRYSIEELTPRGLAA